MTIMMKDELKWSKKKKFGYNQFALFDKIDKMITLNEETKKFLRRLKIKKKIVDKKGFLKYFSYKPTALVDKLLDQNTQDFKKSLDEIKQQKIKLKEDERNSTNNKNKDDELNNILSFIGRVYQFFEYKCLLGEQSDELKLPKRVKVMKTRFNEILSTVTKAKSEGLRINVDGR